MQLFFSKLQILDPEHFIRRAGYGIIFDTRNRSIKSFVKRVHRDLYPRFHLYLNESGDNWIFNLHLDQRRTVYEGVVAHAGEYDGEVVEKEAERIKSFL